MMPVLVVNKVALSLAAIFAVAALVACSSPTSTPSGTAPSGRLSETMDDWVNAVCNSPRFDRGKLMPSATGGGQCANLARVGSIGPVGRYEFVWGTYPLGSDSAVTDDLARLGPYAEGNDGAEQVVFAEFMQENHAGLTPLEKFGFVLHPGKASACYGQYSHTPVECPPAGEPWAAPAQPPTAGPAPSITNSVPAPTAVPPPSNNGRQIPTDADRQGFLGYPGPRCNSTNPVVVIARTAASALVICETGIGRYYYRGVGLQNGLSVEIDDPVQTGAGFVATNNGVQYSVSPSALVITKGSSVLSNEPMVEYWSD